MENIAVGIDFGTSNTKVAVFKDGRIQIVPNSMGDPSTPSVVQILDEGEIIGEETMIHKSDEKHTIIEIKRLLGKNITDLKDLKRRNYDLIGDSNKSQIKVNRNGKDELFSPEQIIALILKKLIKNVSDFMETETMITKAVITVPAYFDSKQISAIEESAKLAGIEILGIINEPTAAALAYGLGTEEDLSNSLILSIMKEDNVKNRKVLVFDLGGGSFDISVLIINNTEFTVKAKLGDNNLGGIDFDYKLIDFCIKNFCQKMNINENDLRKDLNAIRRLKLQCKKAKKQLSKKDSTIINIYNFFNKSDLYIEITRERFNEECEDLYQKIESIIEKVLIESNYTSDAIDDVIMVGGGSKIPKIREILETKFNPNKIRDKMNQDEAVVIGAAWKAHKLIKNDENLKILEITPSSLGVGVISDIDDEREIGLIMSVLIGKNKPLPAKSEVKEYETVKENQDHFKIKIYSGEDKYVKNNRLLGEINIDNLPNGKPGDVHLFISFDVDINGILTIIAEVKSIKKKEIRKYSIYNKDEKKIDDDYTNNKVRETIINLKKNKESKQKLEEIKILTKTINKKNKELDLINDNDKLNILNELCEFCSKIINIYESLRKDNEDSETLYEKLFDFTKLLLKSYSKIIILKEEENNCMDLINKIKDVLSKYINDNIENLLDVFIELKIERPKIYIEIILYVVGILCKEGDRFLKEMKKYAKYNSKKLYQKAEKIKKYIDDDLIKEMNYRLKNQYDDIQKNYGKKVEEIDSFAFLIKKQLQEKDSQFIPNKTGVTLIYNKINKKLTNEAFLHLYDSNDIEEIYLMVDTFEEMKNSLSKKEPTDTEAYCIANIIKINFIYFKNYDFKLYDILNRRINFIYDRIEKDEEQEWLKELEAINEQITTKKEEIENEKNINNANNQKDINDIKIIFKNKIKDNKPKEFIYFLIENYPFYKYDSFQQKFLDQKSFEELFQIIFPLYHPDNYRDREKYIVYHEIYILLVDIEKIFIKKQ